MWDLMRVRGRLQNALPMTLKGISQVCVQPPQAGKIGVRDFLRPSQDNTALLSLQLLRTCFGFLTSENIIQSVCDVFVHCRHVLHCVCQLGWLWKQDSNRRRKLVRQGSQAASPTLASRFFLLQIYLWLSPSLIRHTELLEFPNCIYSIPGHSHQRYIHSLWSQSVFTLGWYIFQQLMGQSLFYQGLL